MSMEAFGLKLGISKMSVSKLENGINNPSKQTILAICREFNINEEWLRTGEGEMKTVLTEEEEVAKIVNAIIAEQPASFRLRLIKYLTYMNEDELQMLEKAVAALAGKDEESE